MIRLILSLLLLINLMAAGKENEWKEVRNRNGVKVYNRRIEGINFKEFMGVVEIEATLSTLLSIFNDVKNGVEWVENVDHMEDIERIDHFENYTYSYSKAPWPVKDRDAVVHNKISQNKEDKVITIIQRGVPHKRPLERKAVRVEKLQSKWIFTPTEEGRVHVSYQVLTDPGGKLPAWLINAVSVSQPYETLLGLREIAGKEYYKGIKLEYIED